MTGPDPRLIFGGQRRDPEAVVLVLHGGRGRSAPVRATAPSAVRMIPIAARIALLGRGRVAVGRVLNSGRGWNPTDDSPLADVRWALDQVRDRFGTDVPVGLVGHSLGGSVALAGAADPSVRSVVALAPWLSGSESSRSLTGRQVLIVHGSSDRITSPVLSAAFARRAAAAAAKISFIEVAGGEHTMLRHLNTFDVLAAGFAVGSLLTHAHAVPAPGVPPAVPAPSVPAPSVPAPDPGGLTDLIRRALRGESPLAA